MKYFFLWPATIGLTLSLTNSNGVVILKEFITTCIMCQTPINSNSVSKETDRNEFSLRPFFIQFFSSINVRKFKWMIVFFLGYLPNISCPIYPLSIYLPIYQSILAISPALSPWISQHRPLPRSIISQGEGL